MSTVTLPGDDLGLPLGDDLFRALGARRVDQHTWSVRSRGYDFIFRCLPHGTWALEGPGGPPGGHRVAHLDEVLGAIAEDMYQAGGHDKLAELRKSLGIKE
jgi:hypothetical protein